MNVAHIMSILLHDSRALTVSVVTISCSFSCFYLVVAFVVFLLSSCFC
jgi:hypothetical protein